MFHHYYHSSLHSGNLAGQLHDASIGGRDTRVLDLLRRGTDPNYYYALHRACELNHPHTAVTLIQWGADLRRRYSGWTPLHCACRYNNMACVRVLLEHHPPTGEPGCVCSVTGNHVC